MNKYIILLLTGFLFSISLKAYEVRARTDEMGEKTLYCYHYYEKPNPPVIGGRHFTSSLMDNLQHYAYNSEIGVEITETTDSYIPYVYFASGKEVNYHRGILILFKSGKRKSFRLTEGEKNGYSYKSKLISNVEELKEYFYNDTPLKMQVSFYNEDKVVFLVTDVQKNAIKTMMNFLFKK
ncbi:MAG: hypothetical protein IJW17_00440 [Lentisphaeria bacterium]|nr:hypothetical protein [Lentisphaeria bacterium]